jgi:pimeloyl-ACP methyl ester carboxylesterase
LALRRDQLRTLIGPAMLDIEALAALNPDPKPWAVLPMPVLLIEGENSARHPLRDSIALLKSALPTATVCELPGQDHNAYLMGRQLLAGAMGDFFQG